MKSMWEEPEGTAADTLIRTHQGQVTRVRSKASRQDSKRHVRASVFPDSSTLAFQGY